MKKIFTLLLGASLATSAMALPIEPQVCTGNHLKEFDAKTASLEMSKMPLITTQDGPNGVLRVMQSGTGESWLTMFQIQGAMTDVFELSDPTTHETSTIEDYPFYCVIVVTNKADGKSSFMSYMTWPTVSAYDQDVWTTDGFDKAAAAAKYGTLEAALAPASIDDVITMMPRIPVLNNFYGTTLILQPDLLGSRTTWNGENYGVKPCSVSQSDGSISYNGSYMEWKSFDAELCEAAIDFTFQLGQADEQGNVTNTFPAVVALSGPLAVLGFADLVLTFDEVHAFNCGLIDSDSEYAWDYANDFTPVKRYFFTWCDEGCTYVARTQEGQTVMAWSSDYLKNDLLQNISPFRIGNAVLRYFNAAIYVPADATDFYGTFTMPEAKYTTKTVNGRPVLDQWLSVPTAYELVPGGYSANVCDQDGFKGVWDYYYVYPGENLSLIGIGDENYGFNFKVSCEGWNGHTILGYSTATIYLHNNANDWDAVSEAPAVSSANHNVLDMDPTSVEEVVSNAPVVSTQYFNLQGQRLNVAPERGIYIQREVKADGTVKASKVVK